jgi:hypothetical protein
MEVDVGRCHEFCTIGRRSQERKNEQRGAINQA